MIEGIYMGLKIEYLGIMIDDKEAALLRTVFEHGEYEFRNRAMRIIEKEGSVAALSLILNKHKEYEFRNRAMKVLEKM